MNINNAKGFTLMEILVGLLLISLTFGLITTGVSNSRDRLDATRQHIERAIAFSIDEATIRNAIIRIHFTFDFERQKITVEAGEDGNYMLPSYLFNPEDLSEEELAKAKKSLRNSFQKVKTFQESDYTLDDDIRIIGIASSISKQLITEGEAAIYFYPTGEKDSALIILGSDEELITIEIARYLLKIKVNYHTLELNEEDSISEKQLDLAKELFEKWISGK